MLDVLSFHSVNYWQVKLQVQQADLGEGMHTPTSMQTKN